MNALFIIGTYLQIDDTLKLMGFQDHHHARVSTAEILTVAVVAAKYFQNHHERALQVMILTHYLPRLSPSRFNRRLHNAWELLDDILDYWGQQRVKRPFFAVDTMPLPVCHKTRAEQCRKIPQVKGYIGKCVAKNEWFCGWRLHWLCDGQGFPVAFDIVPAVWHELNTVQSLMGGLASGSRVYGDGAYISREHYAMALSCDIQLISQKHRGMTRQNHRVQLRLLRKYRNVIESAHSVLEKMGVQRLHAVTQAGFGLKVYASMMVLALNCLLD